MKGNNYLDLMFETNLRHLSQEEKVIYNNLFALEASSSTSQLKDIFQEHQNETKKQIKRLESIFTILDMDPQSHKIQGMQGFAGQAKEILKSVADMNFASRGKAIEGILLEGKDLLKHFANTEANDLALICSGQQVEHFEIASYKFLIQVAGLYENKQIVPLLEESLIEEIRMENRLSKFTESRLKNVISEPK